MAVATTNRTNTAAQNARVRIAGAGFTLFFFKGQPIAFCEQVAHTSPRPIAQFSAIQPMDEPYPIEILAAPAAGPGQLVLNLFELFGQGEASKVWDRLGAPVGGIDPTTGVAFGANDPHNASTNYKSLIESVSNSQTPFAGAVDIVDIFIRQAMLEPGAMDIIKIIRPLSAGASTAPYTEEYNGCQIVDVVDGEQVAVGTVEVIKQITVAYRYISRNGNLSKAFALRHGTGF